MEPSPDLTVKARDQLSNAIEFCEVCVRASIYRSIVCTGLAIKNSLHNCVRNKPQAVASALCCLAPDTVSVRASIDLVCVQDDPSRTLYNTVASALCCLAPDTVRPDLQAIGNIVMALTYCMANHSLLGYTSH